MDTVTIKHGLEKRVGIPAWILPDKSLSVNGWVVLAYEWVKPLRGSIDRPRRGLIVHLDGVREGLPDCLHVWVGQEIRTVGQQKALERDVAEAYGVPYDGGEIETHKDETG